MRLIDRVNCDYDGSWDYWGYVYLDSNPALMSVFRETDTNMFSKEHLGDCVGAWLRTLSQFEEENKAPVLLNGEKYAYKEHFKAYFLAKTWEDISALFRPMTPEEIADLDE